MGAPRPESAPADNRGTLKVSRVESSVAGDFFSADEQQPSAPMFRFFVAKTHHCSAFGDVSVLSLPLTGGQDAVQFFLPMAQAEVTAILMPGIWEILPVYLS